MKQPSPTFYEVWPVSTSNYKYKYWQRYRTKRRAFSVARELGSGTSVYCYRYSSSAGFYLLDHEWIVIG